MMTQAQDRPRVDTHSSSGWSGECRAVGDGLRSCFVEDVRHRTIPHEASPQLDTLRGWSAIAVLVGHVNQIIVAPTSKDLSVAFGLLAQSAVMLFFVLSGFLICKSITGNAQRNGRFSPRAYVVDRANRIIPPLFFSLLLVAVLWGVAPSVFPSGANAFLPAENTARQGFFLDLTSFIGSVLFVNGFFTATVSPNGPLWSLAYEVWYYLAAGIIATIRGRRGFILAAALLVALGLVNRVFVLFSFVWFAGAAVALAHNANLPLRFSRPTGLVFLLTAGLLGGLLIYDDTVLWAPRLQAVFSVCIGFAFAAMLHEMLRGTVRVPVVAPRSAEYSYTLYIVHFPLLLFIFGLTQPYTQRDGWATAGVAVTAALGCWAFARLISGLERLKPFGHRRPEAWSSEHLKPRSPGI